MRSGWSLTRPRFLFPGENGAKIGTFRPKWKEEQQVESKDGKFASHTNGRLEERDTQKRERKRDRSASVKEVRVVGGLLLRE